MLDRNQKNWVHQAHGLRIIADFEIQEGHGQLAPLASITCRPGDVVLKKVPAARLPGAKRGQWIVKNAGGMSVAAGEYGTLLQSYCGSNALIPSVVNASSGETIQVSRGKSISTSRFNHTILHAFIPQIMALRGEVVLHTTSVVIDGRCYLFAGDSGMGKSTLAAGFASRGHTIYSEDIARIEFDSAGQACAFPSYPGVRLRGNSFLLPDDRRTNAQGRFGLPKFRVNVSTSIASEPARPVRAIFFLRRGTTVGPQISRLTPMQAIGPILKSSFLLALPKETRSRESFTRAIGIAKSIPSYELRYKRSSAHFCNLVAQLLQQVSQLH
jgi:hypothetical protein